MELTLSVDEIIEIYGARRKIEAGFKEQKQELGSAETQTISPVAVTNPLHFCMMAVSPTWIFADHLDKATTRRSAVNGRGHFAFLDIRRLITKRQTIMFLALPCSTQIHGKFCYNHATEDGG